jgi:hypothetical protein
MLASRCSPECILVMAALHLLSEGKLMAWVYIFIYLFTEECSFDLLVCLMLLTAEIRWPSSRNFRKRRGIGETP